jgi:hypothetical protein
MSKLTLVIICALLIGGCIAASNITNSVSNSYQLSPEMEEYAVYSALLDNLYPHNETTSFGIIEQTTIFTPPRGTLDKTLQFVLKKTSDDIPQEVIDDLKIKNRDSSSLNDYFNVDVRHVLLQKKDVQNLFSSGGGWNELDIKYSIDQMVDFSRVGFNREMTRALVYTSTQSGPKTGYGLYVYLLKENNIWTIKHKVEVWIS